MTYRELNQVLTSVNDSIRQSHGDQQAAAFVRDNINSVIQHLKLSDSATIQVDGRNYRVDREQLKRALR